MIHKMNFNIPKYEADLRREEKLYILRRLNRDEDNFPSKDRNQSINNIDNVLSTLNYTTNWTTLGLWELKEIQPF